MILYSENPKHNTRKLLELIHEFGKVIGCKINMQKSVAFLYTNNEISEREVKETIPITTASKRIKYLGMEAWCAAVHEVAVRHDGVTELN